MFWRSTGVTRKVARVGCENTSCWALFATAFFLYGIALVMAPLADEPGADRFADASSNLLRLVTDPVWPGLQGGGVKLSGVTPDVYEGAPTPVSALSPQGEGGDVCRCCCGFSHDSCGTDFWFWAFWILAVVTMFVGNLGTGANQREAHAGVCSIAHAATRWWRSQR